MSAQCALSHCLLQINATGPTGVDICTTGEPAQVITVAHCAVHPEMTEQQHAVQVGCRQRLNQPLNMLTLAEICYVSLPRHSHYTYQVEEAICKIYN